MKGTIQTLIFTALVATAGISFNAANAHTGNQVFDTLELLTGEKPERLSPRQQAAARLPLQQTDATDSLVLAALVLPERADTSK